MSLGCGKLLLPLILFLPGGKLQQTVSPRPLCCLSGMPQVGILLCSRLTLFASLIHLLIHSFVHSRLCPSVCLFIQTRNKYLVHASSVLEIQEWEGKAWHPPHEALILMRSPRREW